MSFLPQHFHVWTRRYGLVIPVALIFSCHLILAGCSAPSAPAGSMLQATAGEQEPQPGTTDRLEIESADLGDFLEKAWREMSWARVQLVENAEGMRATALTADGRVVHLHAEVDGDDSHQLRIHVRVGHFGDAELEQRFLRALRRSR